LLAERGYDADFSFDDATEALEGLSDRLSIRQGQGLALHINSSDYTGNTSLADGLGRELASVASQDAARHEVTVFQAFRDSRQDVFDSSETISGWISFSVHDIHIDWLAFVRSILVIRN
jgi:hypothetical protein